MFCTPRRHAAAFALLLSLTPTIGGCTTTSRVPLDARSDLRRVTGVTSRSGASTKFVSPGATISNDTLYGMGTHGQLLLPVDSVATVWKPAKSTGRTMGLVFGLLAGSVAIVAIGVASSPFLTHR